MDAIYMDQSVLNQGVPDVIGKRLVKPVIRKKVKFSKTLKVGTKTQPATVSTMFDSDTYSLIAVNMYPRFPMDTKVEVFSVMQDGERIMVVRGGGYEFTSHGEKIFKEKLDT